MIPSNIDQPGFTLPLSREEFARALRSGHGRVFLHARECGLDGMHGPLLDAILHDPAYQECERRATWAWCLVKLSRNRDEILRTAHARFSEGIGKGRDVSHFFSIAALAALEGRTEYASLMRQAFECEPGLDASDGTEEMRRVFGPECVRFVLRCWRRRMEEQRSFKIETWNLETLLGTSRREDTVAALVEHLAEFPFLTDSLTALERDSDSAARTRAARVPPKQEDFFLWIDRMLASGKPMFHWAEARRFATHADDDHARMVFDRLLVEQDERVVLCLLRYFAARPLPRYDRMIGEMALGADEHMSWAAIRTLELIRAPEIRGLIEEVLRRPPSEATLEFIPLFRANFLPGDANLMASLIPECFEGREEHRAIMDIGDVFGSNQAAEMAPLAAWAFNASHCDHCRERIATCLHRNGWAPTWLLEEALFDSSSCVRKLAAEILGRSAGVPLQEE